MAVIVNNPSGVERHPEDSSVGTILGIILLVLLALALFYYGLPLLRGGYSSGPSVSIPDKINVNVNNPQ